MLSVITCLIRRLKIYKERFTDFIKDYSAAIALMGPISNINVIFPFKSKRSEKIDSPKHINTMHRLARRDDMEISYMIDFSNIDFYYHA